LILFSNALFPGDLPTSDLYLSSSSIHPRPPPPSQARANELSYENSQQQDDDDDEDIDRGLEYEVLKFPVSVLTLNLGSDVLKILVFEYQL
jgi:hypothetical protein